jgi:uncharacterized membrane protein
MLKNKEIKLLEMLETGIWFISLETCKNCHTNIRRSKDRRCLECIRLGKKNWNNRNTDKVAKYKRTYRKRNPEKVKEYTERWKENNPNKVKEQYRRNKSKQIVYKIKNYPRYLLNRARRRAKQFNLEFDLIIDDVKIPEYCPVLKIPLIAPTIDARKRTNNTPTLDRINNSKGYIKNNVFVISWRANRLKDNMTIEEVESLLQYMKYGGNNQCY